MSTSYNPFELLTLPLLKDLLRRHKYFIVVQRFNWPGIMTGKGFMVTPYEEQKSAKAHADKLDIKEGRMIDLQIEMQKITQLIDGPQYFLFLNTFRDAHWASKVLKHYQNNIVLFLNANTTIRIKDGIDIELAFHDGRLKAIIQSKGPLKEFDAYDLIK